MWLRGTVSRWTWFAEGSISLMTAMPSATAFAVPPLSWIGHRAQQRAPWKGPG
jgi:hypothetical protein